MFIRILWMLSYPLLLLVTAALIAPRSAVAASAMTFAVITSAVVIMAQTLARQLPITQCSGLSR